MFPISVLLPEDVTSAEGSITPASVTDGDQKKREKTKRTARRRKTRKIMPMKKRLWWLRQ